MSTCASGNERAGPPRSRRRAPSGRESPGAAAWRWLRGAVQRCSFCLASGRSHSLRFVAQRVGDCRCARSWSSSSLRRLHAERSHRPRPSPRRQSRPRRPPRAASSARQGSGAGHDAEEEEVGRLVLRRPPRFLRWRVARRVLPPIFLDELPARIGSAGSHAVHRARLTCDAHDGCRTGVAAVHLVSVAR